MLGCSRRVLEAGQEPAMQTLVSQLAVTNGCLHGLTKLPIAALHWQAVETCLAQTISMSFVCGVGVKGGV